MSTGVDEHTEAVEMSARPPQAVSNRIYRRRARWYGLCHQIGTCFRDTTWRQELAWLADVGDDAEVLDVCTGTGISAIEYLKVWHAKGLQDIRIVGIDYSEEMLSVGRSRLSGLHLDGSVELLRGDAANLNPHLRDDGFAVFHDSTFGAVLSMFGVGETEDPAAAYREMLRVVKPGGRVAVVDVHRPVKGIVPFYRLQNWLWNSIIVPHVLARFWGAGDPSEMIYAIADTTYRDTLGRVWGFETLVQSVRTDPWWFGLPMNTIGVFCGKKVEVAVNSSTVS